MDFNYGFKEKEEEQRNKEFSFYEFFTNQRFQLRLAFLTIGSNNRVDGSSYRHRSQPRLESKRGTGGWCIEGVHNGQCPLHRPCFGSRGQNSCFRLASNTGGNEVARSAGTALFEAAPEQAVN